MIGIVGIIMIFVMVFGGFMFAGGKMEIILEAMPHEMIVIGGASVGAFLLANDLSGVKQTGRDVMKVFKGPKWKPADYRDLLGLLFDLIRVARSNPVALEEHIENPDASSIFSRYPKIQHDHELVETICDTMREMVFLSASFSRRSEASTCSLRVASNGFKCGNPPVVIQSSHAISKDTDNGRQNPRRCSTANGAVDGSGRRQRRADCRQPDRQNCRGAGVAR